MSKISHHIFGTGESSERLDSNARDTFKLKLTKKPVNVRPNSTFSSQSRKISFASADSPHSKSWSKPYTKEPIGRKKGLQLVSMAQKLGPYTYNSTDYVESVRTTRIRRIRISQYVARGNNANSRSTRRPPNKIEQGAFVGFLILASSLSC